MESRRALRRKIRDARSRRDLANLLDTSLQSLGAILWAEKEDSTEDPHYRSFAIPKRKGGFRTIEAPKGPLVYLQKKLLPFLSALYSPHQAAHAYIKKRGILSNVTPHLGRNYVLKIDLENFFPSITTGRVLGLLVSHPYNLSRDVAGVICAIISHKGKLPQGAVTSPVISNMVCSQLDRDLTQLVSATRVRYTRYADDLTFSSQERMPEAFAKLSFGGVWREGDEIERTIKSNGFTINTKKTRLLVPGHRKIVTGIVINGIKPNVPRAFIRETRRQLYLSNRHGFRNMAEQCEPQLIKNDEPSAEYKFASKLRSRIEYIGMVRGKNDVLYLEYLQRLNNLLQGRDFSFGVEKLRKGRTKLPSLKILHVSDFHFTDKTTWDSTPILKRLLKRLELLVSEGFAPDMIAVTGDIAFSGQPSEYKIADEFFRELINRLNIPLDRLFIVPGNHDVAWKLISGAAHPIFEKLMKKGDKIGQAIANHFSEDGLRDLLLKGSRPFMEFYSNLFGQKMDKPWWRQVIDVRGARVGISGIASSWTSTSERDHGRLIVGLPQVNEVLFEEDEADIRLALLHHPFSWIFEGDQMSTNRVISDTDIVLHGHMHDPNIIKSQSLTGRSLVSAAGACYAGSKYPNSFQLIDFNLAKRMAIISIQTWKDDESCWDYAYDKMKGNRTHSVSL